MVKRALVCAIALAGCDKLTSSFETNDFSGDPFPILIDDSSGAILIGVRESGIAANTQVVSFVGMMPVLTPGL